MTTRYTGGCLCGALRYEAEGPPIYAGLCFCPDCRRASGSGFVPFMGFRADALKITGPIRTFTCKAVHGGNADRNSCGACSSLVFGGILGETDSHTLYAGSLDDPSLFEPKIAIFTRERPDWSLIPEGLTLFDGMPSGPA